MRDPLYLKVLNPGRLGPYSKWQWPPVGQPCPKLTGDLQPCTTAQPNAYHACRLEQLAFWLTPESEIYVIDLGAEVFEHGQDKVYSAEATLIKQISFDKTEWVELGVKTDLEFKYLHGNSEEQLRGWWQQEVARAAAVWGSARVWERTRLPAWPSWKLALTWSEKFGANFAELKKEELSK